MLARWERTVNREAVHIRPRKTIGTPNLHGLGMLKMDELACVWATFEGSTLCFEPYLRLRRGWHNRSTSYTLLLSEDWQQDTGALHRPMTCIRICHWDGALAMRKFQEAASRHDYAVETPTLQCALRFFTADQSQLDGLIQRTASELRSGIAFEPVDRDNSVPEELMFYFCDGLQSFQFKFSPRGESSEVLERLCGDWEVPLNALVDQEGCHPEGSCEVVYGESLLERLERYGT